MRVRIAHAAIPLAALVAVPAGVIVAHPGGAAPAATSFSFAATEVHNMSTLIPPAQRWVSAINKRDRAQALDRAQTYELVWQGVEVYTNHRSLVLYQDMEIDTQFAIEDELKKAAPDWKRAAALGRHLLADLHAAVALSAAGPRMSPLFDDLARLRGARAYVNVVREAAVDGDLAKARAYLQEFVNRFPAVEGLISFRSQVALDETKAALTDLQAKLGNPSAPLADVQAAATLFASRLGYGVNLLNAAARGTDRLKTALTPADLALVAALNQIRDAIVNRGANPAAAGAAAETGPGSVFSTVQPALESKARFIGSAASLRTALNALKTALAGGGNVDAPARTALEQVAIAKQALVGQFWPDASIL